MEIINSGSYFEISLMIGDSDKDRHKFRTDAKICKLTTEEQIVELFYFGKNIKPHNI